MSKTTSLVPGLLGTIAVCLVSSCSPDERADVSQADPRPNVLLITLDTARADHIGAYGCKYAFTPMLDALAKQSVKFNQAFAPAPITLPSHATILTGLYPFYHGIRDNSHFVLNPGVNTLAETLRENGYQTAAVVAAFVLNAQFGLDQGFDTYDDELRPRAEFAAFAVPERNAAMVTDTALEWLNSAKEDRPFFAWVHYFDPHSLYVAPDSFTKYQGHPYDVEIAYADSELQRLLKFVEQLAAKGRRTLIVFAADHGEALGQYGEPTHAYFVYDSTLHVPLLIRMPDGAHAGREIDLPVTLADIMPTVLDVLGLAVPGPDQMHGRSLLPLIETGEASPALKDRPIAFECYEAHLNYGWAPVQGIRLGEKKFIDAPEPELYLLAENPKEHRSANRYTEMPELAAELEAVYHSLYESELSFPPFTKAPETPDADTIDKLRALGYVAAATPTEVEPGAGKDLKEMLPFYRGTLRAMSELSSGDSAGAVRTLLALLEEEPGNDRVLWLLAEIAATKPSVADDALPAIVAALENEQVSPPMVPQTLLACGRAYRAKNDNDRALKFFSEVTTVKQDYAAAHELLGLTYLRLERGANAIASLRRAVELYEPHADRSRIALGLALLADGQAQDSLGKWQEVLDKYASPSAPWNVATWCPLDQAIAERIAPLLRRHAGDASLPSRMQATLSIAAYHYLSLLGKTEEAIAALESARPHLPDDDVALHVKLAKLHSRLGQVAEARRLADRAYQLAPDEIAVVGTLAGVLEQTGEMDRAVELLDTFYQTHLDNSTAANNLAWMLARQGQDLDRALKLAKRAISRLPGDANMNDTLGWIYHLRGDREMARMLLTRATKTAPENATYQYHLAMALQAAGQPERAREAFAKAVELATTPYPDWYEEARRALQDP